MATVEVLCRFCGKSESVKKYGKSESGKQRFRCMLCCKSFQLEYTYNACKKDIKGKIVSMAMNNAGLRDTASVLNIGYNTVLRTLKNSPQSK